MTVAEALKQSGFSDDEIKAMDSRAVSAFTTVLSTAETAQQAAARLREEAELDRRAQQDMWSSQINPALDSWANEKATKDAEITFYRAQAESAKAGGFVPKDAPGYQPPRTTEGQFATNPVPGSPGAFTADQGITGISNAMGAMSEHQRLYNEPMPDDFKTLLNESVAQHLPFNDYVNRKYKFDDKKKEIVAARQQKERDALVKEVEARKDKEWAEKVGNNPNVRVAAPSQFSQIRKSQDAGQRKDPTQMTQDQRREYTRQNIQKEISENANGMVN